MKFNLKAKLSLILCLTSLMMVYYQPAAGSNQLKSVAKEIQKPAPQQVQISTVPSRRTIFLPAVESPAVVPQARTNQETSYVRLATRETIVEQDKVYSRLSSFVNSFSNQSRGGQVTGVFAPGAFALPVVQQPAGDMLFVSTKGNELTLFRRAKQAGSVGLLAHNNLAGKNFFSLSNGSLVYLIYGDGHVQTYEVFQIEDYQALSLTLFRDLVSGKSIDQYVLFDRIYHANNDRVVFQTCIEKGGAAGWGRRFILARLVQNGFVN